MTDADLDRSYCAMCEALGNVGEEAAPLFLSMLSLKLLSRFASADEVLPLVEAVRRQCLAERQPGDGRPGGATPSCLPADGPEQRRAP